MPIPLAAATAVQPVTMQKLAGNVEFALYNGAKLVGLWAFSVKPEEVTQQEITRVNQQQGQITGYVDLYGPGLVQITLSGISPLKLVNVRPNFSVADGYDYFKWFIDNIFRRYQVNAFAFPQNWSLHFYNFVYNEFFEVVPIGLDWNMNVPQQTVFQYELQLLALRRLGQPSGLSQNELYQTLLNYPTQGLQKEVDNATQLEAEVLGVLTGGTSGASNYATAAWQTSDIQNVPAQLLTVSGLPSGWQTNMTSLITTQIDPFLTLFRPSFGVPAPASASQLVSLTNQVKTLRAQLDGASSPTPYLLQGRTTLLQQSLTNMQAYAFLMES